MTPRMKTRRLLFLVSSLWAFAAIAQADPLPLATRQRAEDAFVLGRPEDLDAILGTGTTPVDAEPLAVRDLFWRPTREIATWPASDGSLSSRRIEWLRQEPLRRARGGAWRAATDYPMPALPDEKDPYPRLTALVLERLDRERLGAVGLPESSPALATGDEDIKAFLMTTMGPAYRGLRGDEIPEEERDARARLAAMAQRNVRIAAGAIATLLALAAGAFVLLRRGSGRRSPDPIP